MHLVRQQMAALVAVDDLVTGVIAHAESSDPAKAAVVYQNAAAKFRATARAGAKTTFAADLSRWADEFEARSESLTASTSVVEQHAGGATTTDDFEEQEIDRAQAHQEMGHLDDLEITARERQLHASRFETSRVSIAPASVNEYTALGRSATVKYAPTEAETVAGIKQSNTVLLWQGMKTETQAVTIDIGVFDQPSIGASVSCRPYAVVTFGADGFRTSVRLDVAQGQRITVVGNYVDVLVGMAAPRTGFDSGVMTIGASLGFFGATSVSPVIYTEYVDLLTSIGTATITRPAKAQFLLPVQSTDTTGTTTLDFYGSVGPTDPTDLQFSLVFANGTLVAPIPLMDSVRQIVVTNSSGASPTSYQFPFQLAI